MIKWNINKNFNLKEIFKVMSFSPFIPNFMNNLLKQFRPELSLNEKEFYNFLNHLDNFYEISSSNTIINSSQIFQNCISAIEVPQYNNDSLKENIDNNIHNIFNNNNKKKIIILNLILIYLLIKIKMKKNLKIY